METLVYEIKEEETMLDDYYDFDMIEELVIFDGWLVDEDIMGEWARQEVNDTRWKRQIEKGWIRLSR